MVPSKSARSCSISPVLRAVNCIHLSNDTARLLLLVLSFLLVELLSHTSALDTAHAASHAHVHGGAAAALSMSLNLMPSDLSYEVAEWLVNIDSVSC